jgi:hypothetical protein
VEEEEVVVVVEEGISNNLTGADRAAAPRDSTPFTPRCLGDEPDGDRRGLALLRALHERGLAFLPADLFDWDSLRFRPGEVEKTAFIDGYFRRQVLRNMDARIEHEFHSLVDAVLAELPPTNKPEPGARWTPQLRDAWLPWFEICWQFCLMSYSNWLLRHLGPSGKLPHFNSRALTDEERCGLHGLSYGLISRATRGRFIVVHSVEYKTEPRAREWRKTMRHFPNTWAYRIRLLFDFEDDGYARDTWQSHRWRQWFRHCYDRLLTHPYGGRIVAEQFRVNVGVYGARFLTVLPVYESRKMYGWAPMRQEDGRLESVTKWWAARPDNWEYGTGPPSSQDTTTSTTEKLEEMEQVRSRGKSDVLGLWASRSVRLHAAAQRETATQLPVKWRMLSRRHGHPPRPLDMQTILDRRPEILNGIPFFAGNELPGLFMAQMMRNR